MQSNLSKIRQIILTTPYFLIVPLSWLMLMVFYSPHFGVGYSRDTYAYYFIGKNLFTGEGYTTSVLRDFYINGFDNFFPSRSFPPLWPILIGFIDEIIHKGIASSLFTNLAITYAVLLAWFKYSLKFDNAAIISFGSLLFFLFVNEPFSAEILSGRSIPVVLLCLIALINVLSSDQLTKSYCLLSGVLLGLISLARADCMLFALAAPLVTLARKDIGWQSVVTVYAGILLITSPWLMRNLLVFGTPFASDNTLTVMSTFPATIPITFFEQGPPLLTDDYKLWGAQRVQYFLDNVKALYTQLIPLGGWIIAAFSLSGLFFSIRNSKTDFKLLCLFGLTWIWVIANLASVSLTPFHDPRYFSISAFFIMASGSLAIANAAFKHSGINLPSLGSSHQIRYARPVHYLLAISAFTFIVATYRGEFNRNVSDHYKGLQQAFASIIKPGDLVGSSDADTQGYYTDWKMLYLPTNAPEVDNNFLAWASKWKVKYILVEKNSPFMTAPEFVQKGTFASFVLLDISGALPISDANVLSSPNHITNTTYNLTDANWVNGVARSWAGFFVANSPQNLNLLKPGKKIKFAVGSPRTIVKQQVAGGYINITLDGPPMNGKAVGFPKEFEMLE